MLGTMGVVQKPTARQVMGQRGEPTTMVLLNEHGVKLLPKYLCLYL